MIRLRDIHKEYQNGTKALKGVSMQIDDGDFVFLVGPSGSGKSTIIKLITAEISPTRGKLMVNGYNLNDISEKQIHQTECRKYRSQSRSLTSRSVQDCSPGLRT